MSRATGSPLDPVQDEIIREMAGMEDWLERYQYLVRQGRAMEVRDEGIRTDEYAVPGCQSRVWIRARLENGRLRFVADSDAEITRGLVALLLRVLDGHAPSEIVNAELYFLDETGLGAHLSPSRANGLAAMVERVREYAREVLDAGGVG